jgi:hypothetical protein
MLAQKKTTSRKVLTAVSRAIRALEQPNERFAPLGISRKDEQTYKKAVSLLWDIISRNGKTIAIDTNRLIDDEPFK